MADTKSKPLTVDQALQRAAQAEERGEHASAQRYLQMALRKEQAARTSK